MSNEGKAAPAAPKAGKPGKKKPQKSEVEKLNAGALAAKAWAVEVRKLLEEQPRTAEVPASTRKAVDEAGEDLVAIEANLDRFSTKLLALQRAKWEPHRRRPGEHRAGDLVAMRPSGVERYKEAYAKDDLESLRVVSLHGKLAKVEIFRDGMKGESLGLIHVGYLVARS